MNKMAKKLMAALLCLAMAVALLPAIAVTSNAAGIAPDATILLFEDNFDNKGDWSGSSGTFKDGLVTIKADASANRNIDCTVTGLNVPDGATICIEYSVAATKDQQKFLVFAQGANEGVTLVCDTDKSDISATGIAGPITDTGVYKTQYAYFTVSGAALNQFTLRLGTRKGSGDIMFDYVKLYLIADPVDAVQSANGYAKLSEDVTIESALTLAENAVLDLNGCTLTATIVSPGTNATIIDSSANKTGKLIVPKDSLVLRSNNPQLPLWAADGYIFTEPKLNEGDVKRAFFVEGSTSADGFTLDFRPGFGQTIRENYLSQGNTGIKMTADLSWTDIYGHEGSYEGGLNGTRIFNGMYATATARGRLQITGAEKYRDISLTITLESCGVKYTFDPVVFNNTYVTTHFAADFETEGRYELSSGDDTTGVNIGTINGYGTGVISNGELIMLDNNRIKFNEAISVEQGKKLVIAFDLKTDGGEDSIGVRWRESSTAIVNVISTGGHCGNHTEYMDFYTIDTQNNEDFTLSGVGTYAKIRMEIDLGTGEFVLYHNGVATAKKGTYANVSILATSSLYIHEANDETHYIDNLLVYTVTEAN